MAKYKVLFHIDEGIKGRTDIVLANIANLINDLGEDNVIIELVANSEGINALLKKPNWHKEKIEHLSSKGVRFVACGNSLRQVGLTKDALLENVEIVSAGIGELVKKQAEGWSYIRP